MSSLNRLELPSDGMRPDLPWREIRSVRLIAHPSPADGIERRGRTLRIRTVQTELGQIQTPVEQFHDESVVESGGGVGRVRGLFTASTSGGARGTLGRRTPRAGGTERHNN